MPPMGDRVNKMIVYRYTEVKPFWSSSGNTNFKCSLFTKPYFQMWMNVVQIHMNVILMHCVPIPLVPSLANVELVSWVMGNIAKVRNII